MFIARQAIFNRSMKVYGYELLYRDRETDTSFNNHMSPEESTASVLSGLFELGIDNISSNKKSFINFNYQSLFSDSIELIHPEDLVIEVLENTEIDDLLIERLTELKMKGYRIALDDFIEDIERFPLISVANVIKFDLIRTPLSTIKKEVAYAIANRKIIVAEKIETMEEFEEAKEMGFHLFQGYFFQKPNIIGQSNNKKSPRISYMRIIRELNEEEPSFKKMAAIIKTDVNLTHRLLLTTKNKKIYSDNIEKNIKHSLVYMGFRQIKRWINVLILRDLATDKPDELTQLSLVRARFGELIAENSSFHHRTSEIYGMLLFSALDALLDLPMEKALENIQLSKDVKDALINHSGPLYPLLEIVCSYQNGKFHKVEEIAKVTKIRTRRFSFYYIDAIIYSQKIKDKRYNNF